MSEDAKKIILATLFSLIILIFIVLAIFTIDNKRIRDIEEFISNDIRVLYVTTEKDKDYPVELLKKYVIEYLKIDSSQLTIFEKKKIKKIIKCNNLENTIVVYINGKIVDTLKNYNKEEDVNSFFQKNNIIPQKIVDNVEEIMTNAMNILNSEYLMVYIPYKEHRDVEAQNAFFEQIASEYSIDYQKIDAYLLSNKQQEKINNLLKISLVEDQILILVKEKKIIANIRGIHRKNTFIENMYEVNFINELEDKIERIDYDDFESLLNNSLSNILMIGSENLKDSTDIYNLLNKMIYNYDLSIKYINVDKEDSAKYNEMKEKLEDIGYDGAYSLPIVLILNSDGILDYIIGNTKEEYFLDVFIENGVIKGEVIDE